MSTMPWCILLLALAVTVVDPVKAMNETCVAASIKRFATCSAGFAGAVDPGISTNFLDVLYGCSGREQAKLSVNVSVPNTAVLRAIYRDVTPVVAAANLTMDITFQPLSSWLESSARVNGSGWDAVTGHDAWILNPVSAGTLLQADMLQDLTDIALSDTHMQWQDIHPFYRLNVANYGGKVVMLPMDGQQWIMYVRHDVLAQHSVGIPRTWDELLAVAAVVNGTDMNNDGVKDYAICLPTCLITFMINSIWASIMQTHGMHQGLHYDIDTMQVMANTSAMAYALEVYHQIFAFTRDENPLVTGLNNCLAYQPKFTDGKCAITFGAGQQFKQNSRGGSCSAERKCTQAAKYPYVRGLVTAALNPGSTRVFVRSSGTLETCTKQLCPYATTITTANGSSQLVNFVPWTGFGGGGAAISKQTDPLKAYYAWFFVTWFTYPKGGVWYLLNPDYENGPYRLSHLDETLMKETYGFTYTDPKLVNYDASDTATWLSTLSAALSHPNLAMDLRMPGSHPYRSMVQLAGYSATFGKMSVAAVMQLIAAASAQLVPKDDAGLVAMRSSYWVSVNHASSSESKDPQQVSPPPPAGVPSASSSLSVAGVVGIVVGSIIALLFFLLLGYWYLHRHRSLWSVILPPKAGPNTTLLVTDIESSTVLWETCEAEVMDAALKLHHSVIRKALLMYAGYESATEGDSFIAAFHSAQAALQFSLHVQLKLLEASWPADLDAVPASLLVSTSILSPKPSMSRGSLGGSVRCKSSSWSALSLLAYSVPENTLNLRWRADSRSESCSQHHMLPPLAAADEASRMIGTVRDCLAIQYPIAADNGRGTVPLYRGLRVRIGFHSGVAKETDINSNAASGRTTYSGDPLAAAKSVGDAAHGGQVMLSEAAIATLDIKCTHRSVGVNTPYLILSAGLHKVRDGLPPCRLYMASSAGLHARLALFKPVRSLVQLAPGVLQAPLGMVAAAVVTFPGAASLMEWDKEEARRALNTVEECCSQLACDHGGFPTVSDVGEITCAFHTCSAAVEWALVVINAMKSEPWSDELLSHPLCEALCVDSMADESAVADSGTPLPGLGLKQLFQKKPSRKKGLTREGRHQPSPRRSFKGPSLLSIQIGAAIGPSLPPSPSDLKRRTVLHSSESNVLEPEGLPSMLEEGDPGSPASDSARESQRELKAAAGGGSVMFRGPRIKAGVAFGDVHADVLGSNGRLHYGGKVVGLARGIAMQAKSSQVLCSRDVSQRIAAEQGPRSALTGHVPIVCHRWGSGAQTPSDNALYKCRFDAGVADKSIRSLISSSVQQQQAAACAGGSRKWEHESSEGATSSKTSLSLLHSFGSMTSAGPLIGPHSSSDAHTRSTMLVMPTSNVLLSEWSTSTAGRLTALHNGCVSQLLASSGAAAAAAAQPPRPSSPHDHSSSSSMTLMTRTGSVGALVAPRSSSIGRGFEGVPVHRSASAVLPSMRSELLSTAAGGASGSGGGGGGGGGRKLSTCSGSGGPPTAVYRQPSNLSSSPPPSSSLLQLVPLSPSLVRVSGAPGGGRQPHGAVCKRASSSMLSVSVSALDVSASGVAMFTAHSSGWDVGRPMGSSPPRLLSRLSCEASTGADNNGAAIEAGRSCDSLDNGVTTGAYEMPLLPSTPSRPAAA